MNMYALRGFMLIELMLYSGILVIVVVILMSYAVKSHLVMYQQIREASLYAHMSMALDRLVDDLTSVVPSCPFWKTVTPTTHIWTTATGDIGWENTSQGLIRSHGKYSSNSTSWMERQKSYFQDSLAYNITMAEGIHESTIIYATIETKKGNMKASRMIVYCDGIGL